MRAAIGLGWAAAICGHRGACGQPTVPVNLPLLLCRLSGYIFDEKVAIARTYLEPQASPCVDLLASSYCDSLLAGSSRVVLIGLPAGVHLLASCHACLPPPGASPGSPALAASCSGAPGINLTCPSATLHACLHMRRHASMHMCRAAPGYSLLACS